MPASRTTGSSTSATGRAWSPCHLAGEFGYADASPVTGVFVTDAPFPIRIDLDQLGSW